MSDEKNKCITDISMRKKLNKVRSFKDKIINAKSEEQKNDALPKLINNNIKIKGYSIFFSNSKDNSTQKPKLILLTREQLNLYLDESKKNKNKGSQRLHPIFEESKNDKNMRSKNNSKINNIKSNKTVQIKTIKLISKEENLKKNISESSNLNIKINNDNNINDIENNKKEEKKSDENEIEKEKEKEKPINEQCINNNNQENSNSELKETKNGKNDEETTRENHKNKIKKVPLKENENENNKINLSEKVKDTELKPIVFKGKNISAKANNDILIIKNAIKEEIEEKNNNLNINCKSLNSIPETNKKKSLDSISLEKSPKLKTHSNNANNKQKNTSKKEYKLQYCVYPGNNSALIDKVMIHRNADWEKVPTTYSDFCDLVWAPLTCNINFQNCEKSHQYVNHIEFNIEISNKMRLYANLLRHCEEKKIDVFSIFPFTISLQLSHWSFNEQLSNFKKLYNNIDNYTPSGHKKFSEMFNVILSRKIGSNQNINIPQTFNSGKNLWIIKPVNLNRGRYITVEKNLKEIIKKLEEIQEKKKINVNDKKKGTDIKCEYILIQKYLEKPLLYQGRKFDIRLWVLFIAEQEDDIYIFRQGHLKATCNKYDPDSNDLYVHLTNYSVQKYNQNFSKIEIGNEIPFKDFQNELNKNKTGIDFYNDIYPKIVKIVRITGGAAKGKINFLKKKYCFEIFGYDFILDENYQPYLLEINTNPGLEISSPIIDELLPRMIDDALKLTVDREFAKSMKYSEEESTFNVKDFDNKKNMWEKYSII